jgi:hypothetical protein
VTRQAATEDALELRQGNDVYVRFPLTLDGAPLTDDDWAAAEIDLVVKESAATPDADADFTLTVDAGIDKRAKADEDGATVAVARFTAAQLAAAGSRFHRLDVVVPDPGRRTFRQGPFVVIDT